jgi:hypothetical protein
VQIPISLIDSQKGEGKAQSCEIPSVYVAHPTHYSVASPSSKSGETLKQFLVLIFLCLSFQAGEKDSVGSVLAFATSSNKIVIGADSRELTLWSNGRADRFDKCKVVTLDGTYVFAAVGRSGHHSQGHPEATWDIFDMVREIARKDHTAGSLGRVAADWGNEVAKMDNRDSPDFTDFEGQHAIFAGFIGGHPTIYQVIVTKNAAGPYQPDVQQPSLQNGSIVASGYGKQIAEEFAAGRTDRAKSWMADFRKDHAPELNSWDTAVAPLVKRVLELTIANSAEKDTSGPPIDLVEIRPTGVHWLEKKPNCPE